MTRGLALWLLCASLGAPLVGHADPVPTMTIRPTALSPSLLALKARGIAKIEIEGDISGARRVLGPVAEAGSAEAARMIAETYDPIWLAHHVIEIDGLSDPEEAFLWYKRAAELGDTKPGNLYVDNTSD